MEIAQKKNCVYCNGIFHQCHLSIAMRSSDRYQKTMNITEVIDRSPLSKLIQKALVINELNQKLYAVFPFELRVLLRVNGVNDGALELDVANAMARQSLLFRQNEFLPQLNAIAPEIKRLKIKVVPDLAR